MVKLKYRANTCCCYLSEHTWWKNNFAKATHSYLTFMTYISAYKIPSNKAGARQVYELTYE